MFALPRAGQTVSRRAATLAFFVGGIMEHHFDTEDAAKHGVIGAVILYNIRYWVQHNKAYRANIRDGRVWTFNSVKAYAKLFPYLTSDQVRRALEKLESAGAIITDSYNKRSGDRTKWYSIPGEEGEDLKGTEAEDQDQLAESPEHLASVPNQLAELPNGIGENATALPDIKPYNKPDTKHKQTGAPDISPDIGRLDGLIEQYSAKVCRVDRIALDFRIRGAVAKAGIDTVEKCLRAILQAAENQDYPKDKLPRSIFALLGDVERIDGWARRIVSDHNGWAEDSEHNAKKVARMLKHSVPIPDEAKRHIPRAEKLLEARAV